MHVLINKPVVLEPYKTRMIVPPYAISRSGLQAMVGTRQIAHLLVSVSLGKSGEFGIHVFNSSKESKYLSQNLTLASIIMYLETTMTWDRTIE